MAIIITGIYCQPRQSYWQYTYLSVNPDGNVIEGNASSMCGFTNVKADSIDDVNEMAMTCPFLDIEGSLEVSELMQMSA